MPSTHKIKVAISGGGLAGAAIARALLPHDHLDVHIYESAPEFSERGMGIIMAVNAQRALEHIVGGEEEVEGMFKRAGAVVMNSSRIMMGAGPHAGTKILDIAQEKPSKTMARADLLRELLAPIPRENMHVNKKLVAIDEAPAGLLLKFEDGTSTTVDALLGADGIFGFVRGHVLGSDHEAVKAVPAGWAGTVNMVPFEKAREVLGAQWFEEDRQYGWVGPGGIFIHDLANDGKMVQCIGTTVAPWASAGEGRRERVDREYLEGVYGGWKDSPVKEGMIELLLDQASPTAYATYEHLATPTYTKNRICIAGDAAHAMTPWQGSGAAMALEDAVILGCLLAAIASPAQVPRALQVYDKVRRPRTQRVAQSSRETGKILSGIDARVGLDVGKMRDALRDRWSFIHRFVLEEEIELAVKELEN